MAYLRQAPRSLSHSLAPDIGRGGFTGIHARDGVNVMASQGYRLWKLASAKFEKVMVLVKDISSRRYLPIEVSARKANGMWLNAGPTDAGQGQSVLGKSKLAQKLAAMYDFWPHQTNEERDQHQMLMDIDGWGR